MKIGGYQKTTLLDYPDHVAATIFTYGCNFRCPFCHNSGLLGISPSLRAADLAESTSPPETPGSGKAQRLAGNRMDEEVLSFLRKRKNILTGVCITGGEPTLQPDLAPFLREIKSLGYKVKLDTNGYLPNVLSSLLEEGLLDYIAMDIKTGPTGYAAVTGLKTLDFSNILESIHRIENSRLPYEFRTTLVKEFHEQKDLLEIADLLSPESPYYLQSFRDGGNVLQPGLHAHNKKTLEHFLALIQTRLPRASLRGIE